MVEFGKLNPDGTYEVVRELPQGAISRCPHFILAIEHYRDDNSCKCNDPDDPNMSEWGYTWDPEKKIWK